MATEFFDNIDDFKDMHEFFAGLNFGQRKQLAQIASVRTLTADEEIARTSEPVDGIYLIIEGTLRLESFSENGEQFLVGILEEGDVFGLLSVIDRKPSQHYVTPGGPTKAIFVPAARFREFIFGDAKLGRLVAEMLCQRLRMSLVLIDRFGLGSKSCRVVHCLISLAEYYSFRPGAAAVIELSINQYDIASMLAVSRQSVNRELKELEQAGLVEILYGNIRINDLAGLKKTGLMD